MRRGIATLCLCLGLLPSSLASEPSLWAFNSGELWSGSDLSHVIALDPFASFTASYPPGQTVLEDASYCPASSTLFVSGGDPGHEPWWYQNTISIYVGGPHGLEFVSSSNAGMGDEETGYHWLGGIAYTGDALYAIAYTGYEMDNVLLRIENPGTASQTVTQIGEPLGTTSEMGPPFGLCPDGQGGLFGVLGETAGSSPTGGSTLYRIDTTAATATPLQFYSDVQLEGLALSQGNLYALSRDGDVWQIDTDTYSHTVVGTLPYSAFPWTGLTIVPEPTVLALAALSLAAVLYRATHRLGG